MSQIYIWVGFNIFIVTMLLLDLGVFHRKSQEVQLKEALIMSGVWIALALVFNVIVYYWRGSELALQFLTGYVLEKSLSVDNLFVFLMVFSYFSVPTNYQHKILFWGIFGALVMRAFFIAVGVTLLSYFHWVIYVFGVILVVTGIRMARQDHDNQIEPDKNPVLKLFKRFMPVVDRYEGSKFFIKEGGRRLATPMMVVLIIVETTDLIFAVDSIPAILAISQDPFIVYTSNAFAILGLRALYFALAGIMQLFHYLQYGLSFILVFIGMKMLLADLFEIPIGVALGVVAGVLTLSILASLFLRPPAKETTEASPLSEKVSSKV